MAVMERITGGRSASFPSFTPLIPGEERWVSGVHRCGTRRAVCWQKSPPAVIKCVSVFFFFAPAAPGSLPPGDKQSRPQTHTCTLTAPTVNRHLQTQQEVCFYFGITLVSILLLLFFLWQPFYCTGVNWISTLFKLPLYSKLPKRREIREGFQQLGQQPGCAAIDGGTSMLTLRWINVKHSEG